jgi:predicted O-methyltransferase YrrM
VLNLVENWNRAKRRGFKACVRYAVERIDPLVGFPVGRLEYRYSIFKNQPYFGHFRAAGVGVSAGVHNVERRKVREANMRRLVAACCSSREGNSRVLEVGSWAGWSAIVWARALEQCKQTKGSVICVDPWVNYLDLALNRDMPVYRAMAEATKRDGIMRLFYHNVRSAGYAAMVHPFRGSADYCLPLLRDVSFSLAFIDGDHAYSAVKRDLHNASRLLCDGGLLCGDDLEYQFGEVDELHLRTEAERDWTVDPKSSQGYHPGVALAVWDFFRQKVSCWDGLWAMRKAGDAWKPVELP